MNYTSIYNKIINRAIHRTKFEFSERHHIIPKSFNGTNDKSNLVYLTPKEHFLCHLLLVKMYYFDSVRRKKMTYALWWMCKTRKNTIRITSRIYEFARKEFVKANVNNEPNRKLEVARNRKEGKYKYNYEVVSKTLKQTLSNLTSVEKYERMKNSAMTCNQVDRGKAIAKGKASFFKLIKVDGSTLNFSSFDNVLTIVGYSYDHIKYRLRAYDGKLKNGCIVVCISRYDSNKNKK